MPFIDNNKTSGVIVSVVLLMILLSLCGYLLWVFYALSGAQGAVSDFPVVLNALQGADKTVVFIVLSIACVSTLLAFITIFNVYRVRKSTRELKRVNAVLENRLAAMEQSADGLYTVDHNGILRYMNRRFMEILDISPDDFDEYVDKPWLDVLPADVRAQFVDVALSALELDASWSGSFIITRGGVQKVIDVSCTRLPTGGMVVTNRDVTQKQCDDQARQELQSQFYQAQKMEAIGRIAGGVAHDFNNILAAINGYTEFLIEDLEDRPSEQKFAHKIMGATQQAKKLVDQILTFSRRNEVVSEVIDLGKIVDESKAMIEASAMSAIEVQSKKEVDHAYIDGNSTQISQVVMNLCVNAMDAMEGRSGLLRIEIKPAHLEGLEALGAVVDDESQVADVPVARIDDGGQADQTVLVMGQVVRDKSYVCLSVSDTGSGITREIMEHAFEPFFTTKAVDKGTGLGLSIVQGVIAQYHGAMVVDSIVGLGTQFKLYFPLMEQDVAEPSAAMPTFSKFEFEGARILLVEDQKNVQEMMEKMLLRMGFGVIVCDHGREALALLDEHQKDRPFDLVLTDHAMPQMTGLELAQKSSKLFPDLPFVIVSGYSNEKLRDVISEYPSIKTVLRKPVTREELRESIYMALADKCYDPVTEGFVDRYGTGDV